MAGIRKPSPQPIMRNLVRTISPMDALLAAFAWLAVLACLAWADEPSGVPASNAPAAQDASESRSPQDAEDGAAATDDDDQARAAMWSSPEMLAARQWLVAYFNATGRYTPEEARAYVERLSHLSPTQMRAWLVQIGELQRRMASRERKLAEHRQWSQALAEVQQIQRSRIAAREAQAQQLRTLNSYDRFRSPYGYDPRVDPVVLKRAAVRERLIYEQYGPLESLLLLNYLDVQDIRDDLRALRAQKE